MDEPDLCLYDDLIDNDELFQSPINPETENNSLNELLSRCATLETERNELDATIRQLGSENEKLRVEVAKMQTERDELQLTRETMTSNCNKLGLACRCEIRKLKMKIENLCRKLGERDRRNNCRTDVGREADELRLSEDLSYSTVIRWLHSSPVEEKRPDRSKLTASPDDVGSRERSLKRSPGISRVPADSQTPDKPSVKVDGSRRHRDQPATFDKQDESKSAPLSTSEKRRRDKKETGGSSAVIQDSRTSENPCSGDSNAQKSHKEVYKVTTENKVPEQKHLKISSTQQSANGSQQPRSSEKSRPRSSSRAETVDKKGVSQSLIARNDIESTGGPFVPTEKDEGCVEVNQNEKQASGKRLSAMPKVKESSGRPEVSPVKAHLNDDTRKTLPYKPDSDVKPQVQAQKTVAHCGSSSPSGKAKPKSTVQTYKNNALSVATDLTVERKEKFHRESNEEKTAESKEKLERHAKVAPATPIFQRKEKLHLEHEAGYDSGTSDDECNKFPKTSSSCVRSRDSSAHQPLREDPVCHPNESSSVTKTIEQKSAVQTSNNKTKRAALDLTGERKDNLQHRHNSKTVEPSKQLQHVKDSPATQNESIQMKQHQSNNDECNQFPKPASSSVRSKDSSAHQIPKEEPVCHRDGNSIASETAEQKPAVQASKSKTKPPTIERKEKSQREPSSLASNKPKTSDPREKLEQHGKDLVATTMSQQKKNTRHASCDSGTSDDESHRFSKVSISSPHKLSKGTSSQQLPKEESASHRHSIPSASEKTEQTPTVQASKNRTKGTSSDRTVARDSSMVERKENYHERDEMKTAEPRERLKQQGKHASATPMLQMKQSSEHRASNDSDTSDDECNQPRREEPVSHRGVSPDNNPIRQRTQTRSRSPARSSHHPPGKERERERSRSSGGARHRSGGRSPSGRSAEHGRDSALIDYLMQNQSAFEVLLMGAREWMAGKSGVQGDQLQWPLPAQSREQRQSTGVSYDTWRAQRLKVDRRRREDYVDPFPRRAAGRDAPNRWKNSFGRNRYRGALDHDRMTWEERRAVQNRRRLEDKRLADSRRCEERRRYGDRDWGHGAHSQGHSDKPRPSRSKDREARYLARDQPREASKREDSRRRGSSASSSDSGYKKTNADEVRNTPSKRPKEHGREYSPEGSRCSSREENEECHSEASNSEKGSTKGVDHTGHLAEDGGSIKEVIRKKETKVLKGEQNLDAHSSPRKTNSSHTILPQPPTPSKAVQAVKRSSSRKVCDRPEEEHRESLTMPSISDNDEQRQHRKPVISFKVERAPVSKAPSKSDSEADVSSPPIHRSLSPGPDSEIEEAEGSHSESMSQPSARAVSRHESNLSRHSSDPPPESEPSSPTRSRSSQSPQDDGVQSLDSEVAKTKTVAETEESGTGLDALPSHLLRLFQSSGTQARDNWRTVQANGVALGRREGARVLTASEQEALDRYYEAMEEEAVAAAASRAQCPTSEEIPGGATSTLYSQRMRAKLAKDSTETAPTKPEPTTSEPDLKPADYVEISVVERDCFDEDELIGTEEQQPDSPLSRRLLSPAPSGGERFEEGEIVDSSREASPSDDALAKVQRHYRQRTNDENRSPSVENEKGKSDVDRGHSPQQSRHHRHERKEKKQGSDHRSHRSSHPKRRSRERAGDPARIGPEAKRRRCR